MKDTFWVEDSDLQSPVCKKRKRRVGKRIIDFIGWGSRPLIEFLEAIGKDTSEKHPRQEVAAFINKYINDNGLTSAEKKKKVICDEKLYALFGKKTMSRIKVFDMLEEHFAENHDSDDESLNSSDEDYAEKKLVEFQKIPISQRKKVLKTPKSCYAAVTPENIKLIYLKRSVIQDLLKFPESFEFKILGSFVRMKSDPNDIYQKNRFQLQKVTGIEKISGTGDADVGIHLRVSNFFKDVTISILSDDNFTKEEVDDICDRIKAGSLNRLTVDEVQLKAQALHVDITNNWIAKEISLLQMRIEHANEKGWQKEKFEYLERRTLLQKPSEQEKILSKIPEVVAEDLEPEAMVNAASEKAALSACSPKSVTPIKESSDVSSPEAAGPGEIDTPPKVNLSDSRTLEVQNGGINWVADIPLKDLEVQNGGFNWVADIPHKDLKVPNGGIDSAADIPHKDKKVYIIKQGVLVPKVSYNDSSNEMQHPQGREEPEQPLTTTPIQTNTATQVICSGEENPQPASSTTVIELSDGDSEDDAQEGAGIYCENPKEPVWHYTDPQGRTQGPFSLSSLKLWNDANYFPSSFMVWKSGQTSDDGVLLVDVLHRTYPYCCSL
ncbi:uncharacterized protein At5g08430-like [Salvia splendens]|uniref:uncharacterized protein At5g08430-like n=1 Tax=Salvia splendens TaxID=180675 RepID=UPI001C25D9A3|nr:uncharacterized protein At5g08430-like [Salvia splendens]XP_042028781.1 uncharacterized protein At5g08430-like [Salvia splendens]XP_042028782.1 uncharacterized protein At5g08430-like [Salvia splendens]